MTLLDKIFEDTFEPTDEDIKKMEALTEEEEIDRMFHEQLIEESRVEQSRRDDWF